MLRAIGNHAYAQEMGASGTGTSDYNVYQTCQELFGSSNVTNWNALTINVPFNKNEMLLVGGLFGTSGHAWVCDGNIRIVWDKYAEIPNSNGLYQTYYQGRQSAYRLHFDWGWNGDSNGWYYHLNPQGQVTSGDPFPYTNLQYLKIK